jgi:hypothetical protein
MRRSSMPRTTGGHNKPRGKVIVVSDLEGDSWMIVGGFSYGNGCHQHDNCFTCPFPDCSFDCHSKYRKKKGVKVGVQH